MLGPFAVMNLLIRGTVPIDLKVYEIFSRLFLHVFARAICILRLSSYSFD